MTEAGFVTTASWPKARCTSEGGRQLDDLPRLPSRDLAGTNGNGVFWEDIEPLVAKAVRNKVAEFANAGIKGVDLYLASFGPALEKFSRHWPLRRGQPRPMPTRRRVRPQHELLEERFDPYAATPEHKLEAARRAVKQWRLEQLTRRKGRADLNPLTAWFVLAWDAFEAPQIPAMVFLWSSVSYCSTRVRLEISFRWLRQVCRTE
jgi:hypothetical protein